MQEVHPMALFRLTVLGSLASREQLAHGELKQILRQLAAVPHQIPGTQRAYVSEKTIEAWYYAYRKEGLDGLTPKTRSDAGLSKLSAEIQEAILQAKRDKPNRSITRLITLLEMKGVVAKGILKKSTVHRLLKNAGISRLRADDDVREEKRSFVAEFANDLWQGDVMHGPRLMVNGRWRKTYLVSLMDDASRLLVHSAFYLAEGAIEIENVLKQAVLKRGLPKKIIIDNGAAYRAKTLQAVCARLHIHLVYCRPYHPEGKGKLEKWHRTVRAQFLGEIDMKQMAGLDDLNARLWVWLEKLYHSTIHSSLDGLTPLQRYQQDLNSIRPLGRLAEQLDELFLHRHPRTVRKDGTVSYEGKRFEVPYELSGHTINVVVDPLVRQPVGIESKSGQSLGGITPLDAVANNTRRRCRNRSTETVTTEGIAEAMTDQSTDNIVELAYQQNLQACHPLHDRPLDKTFKSTLTPDQGKEDS